MFSDEMTSQRDIAAQGSTILAAMISNLLPQAPVNTSLISSLPVTPSITSYNQAVVSYLSLHMENANNLGFRPCSTQTGLYGLGSQLES